MSQDTFKALVLRQEDGKTVHSIDQLTQADLPEGDVLLAVDYSSINYKDSLAVTGTGKIVLTWPMVPGIDLVGRVIESESPDYKAGDAVVLTGWGVGEKYWGGYSQVQRVQSKWLVPLPEGMNPLKSMAIGTAGLTAMLCVLALEEGGVTPDQGPVIVSGASGGVGSVAVAVLSKLGYSVTALTGDNSKNDYLKSLGAAEILERESFSEAPRPLEAQKWYGGIDTVGDIVLARMLAETQYSGTVAACGLAGGFKLPSTVMPFILRNVRLQGVDSVSCPVPRRLQAWKRLVTDLPEAALNSIQNLVPLEEVPQIAADMIAGKTKGRNVVDLNA